MYGRVPKKLASTALFDSGWCLSISRGFDFILFLYYLCLRTLYAAEAIMFPLRLSVPLSRCCPLSRANGGCITWPLAVL